MTVLSDAITARIAFLEKFETKCLHVLGHAPEGHLRVCREHNRCQYYQLTEENPKNGRYLGKKEEKLRNALSMKDYAERALPIAQKELAVLRIFRKRLQIPAAEDVYNSLHPLRKKCIEPFWLPDDLLARRWEETLFRTKGIGEKIPEFITDNGERVRSKSEVLIADKLKKLGIPYRYECELCLKNGITIFPDFTILNVRTRRVLYYEHLGRMDDPDYIAKTVRRMEWYRENGILIGDQLFITWETKEFPLNMRSAEKLYRTVFM